MRRFSSSLVRFSSENTPVHVWLPISKWSSKRTRTVILWASSMGSWAANGRERWQQTLAEAKPYRPFLLHQQTSSGLLCHWNYIQSMCWIISYYSKEAYSMWMEISPRWAKILTFEIEKNKQGEWEHYVLILKIWYTTRLPRDLLDLPAKVSFMSLGPG